MKTKKRLKNKRNGKGFFSKNLSLSWKYIKESKNYIWIIIATLVFSLALGVFYQPPELVEIIKKIVQELLDKTATLNWWQMIVFIFNNNLKTSFFYMLLGVFFGILPVMAAFTNGYVLGFVAEKSVFLSGASSLWRLLPHGIFEFPALIISLALGVKLGMFILVRKGRRKREFFRRFQESLRTFLFIVLPLLVVAAVIEGLLIVTIK